MSERDDDVIIVPLICCVLSVVTINLQSLCSNEASMLSWNSGGNGQAHKNMFNLIINYIHGYRMGVSLLSMP